MTAKAGLGDATPTWPDLLDALLRREDLTTDQAAWAMHEVMSGEASPVQLAGFPGVIEVYELTGTPRPPDFADTGELWTRTPYM